MASLNTARLPLGERLVAEGLLTDKQLQQALDYQRNTGLRIGEAIVAQNLLPARAVGKYLQASLGFPFVDIMDREVSPTLARTLPEELARRKVLLPFAEEHNVVHVAMADPLDVVTVDELRVRLHRHIEPHLAFRDDLLEIIGRIYDVRDKTASVLEEIAGMEAINDELSSDELAGLASDAPIVKLVNNIVQAATTSGASDIHIEPQEGAVRVRFRQDGLLHEQMTFPPHHLSAVVSRIKIMARLDIAEHRRPQDGRFVGKDDNGREYDLRVSIMPLVYGEKIVMRVLPKNGVLTGLVQLGFYPEQQEQFAQFIHQPHGVVLVTGPTGSGKSTTLFAALSEINDLTRNINTVEDPVEYHLPGVNQMQVNPKLGVTFAAGLRTLVRQDPDVIMVGEIRDTETAEIAIQAALTGHLVLSTLHTNDAPGALVRLQNMGVEPFLIGSALTGVVAQRLLRTICPFCKEARMISRAQAEALGLPLENGQPPLLAMGRGCIKCNGRGMKGRTAIYEIMSMSDALREMVLARKSGAHLKTQAVSEGMATLRTSALRKVVEGVTTPEEVLRVLSHALDEPSDEPVANMPGGSNYANL